MPRNKIVVAPSDRKLRSAAKKQSTLPQGSPVSAAPSKPKIILKMPKKADKPAKKEDDASKVKSPGTNEEKKRHLKRKSETQDDKNETAKKRKTDQKGNLRAITTSKGGTNSIPTKKAETGSVTKKRGRDDFPSEPLTTKRQKRAASGKIKKATPATVDPVASEKKANKPEAKKKRDGKAASKMKRGPKEGTSKDPKENMRIPPETQPEIEPAEQVPPISLPQTGQPTIQSYPLPDEGSDVPKGKPQKRGRGSARPNASKKPPVSDQVRSHRRSEELYPLPEFVKPEKTGWKFKSLLNEVPKGRRLKDAERAFEHAENVLLWTWRDEAQRRRLNLDAQIEKRLVSFPQQ